MMKKTLSMLLVVAMIMSLSVCAFAGETQDVNQASNTADMNLEGTISGDTSKLLSVVVPTSIDFVIATKTTAADVVVDRNATATASGVSDKKIFDTLISGTGEITNNTADSDIKVEISALKDDVKLLDKVNLSLGKAVASATKLNDFVAGTPVELLDKVEKNGGKATIELFGEGATANITGTDYNVQLDDGTATVVVTLKVSAVGE